MTYHETPKHKALYFDLSINELRLHYSSKNPKGGYAEIQYFMSRNDFKHEQYSGYHSIEQTTDMKIFALVDDMMHNMPWLQYCIRKFEVTDVGDNYDLTKVIPDCKIELIQS